MLATWMPSSNLDRFRSDRADPDPTTCNFPNPSVLEMQSLLNRDYSLICRIHCLFSSVLFLYEVLPHSVYWICSHLQHVLPMFSSGCCLWIQNSSMEFQTCSYLKPRLRTLQNPGQVELIESPTIPSFNQYDLLRWVTWCVQATSVENPLVMKGPEESP